MNDDGQRTISQDGNQEIHTSNNRRPVLDSGQHGTHYVSHTATTSWRPRASIELDIQELVLDGFADLNGERVAASIEQALVGLFAERGVPVSLGNEVAVPALDAGALRIEADADSSDVGAQIARAIYEGFA